MTNQTAANRYAKALFDVALNETDPQVVEVDLAGFVELITTQTSLRQALSSPAVPVERKQAVLSAISDRVKEVSPAVVRLLELLIARDRLLLLPEIVTAYQARVREHMQVLRAKVTTALPLPSDRHQTLAKRLGGATNCKIELETHVDPSIVGGAIVKLGSTIYDGSIVRQLERMRQQFENSL